MTPRRLFWIVLPATLAAFVLHLDDVAGRWEASRTVKAIESGSLKAAPPRGNLILLDRVAEMDPLLIDIPVNRAHQYLRANSPTGAIRVLKEALALEERAEVYANLGQAYLVTGDRDRAEEAFRKALLLDISLQAQVDQTLRAWDRKSPSRR